MDTALELAGPAYTPPALAAGDDLAETDDVVWWVVVVGFAYALCPCLGCVVPSQRWQRRDLVRLVGLQGCLQELRTPSTGGRPCAALPSPIRCGRWVS